MDCIDNPQPVCNTSGVHNGKRHYNQQSKTTTVHWKRFRSTQCGTIPYRNLDGNLGGKLFGGVNHQQWIPIEGFQVVGSYSNVGR